jgi:hypothetical protein
VCKNCWKVFGGLVDHWNGSQFLCEKPLRRPTSFEKWWIWYEAFCGPRTEAAEQRFDQVKSREDSPSSSQQIALASTSRLEKLGHLPHRASTVGEISEHVDKPRSNMTPVSNCQNGPKYKGKGIIHVDPSAEKVPSNDEERGQSSISYVHSAASTTPSRQSDDKSKTALNQFVLLLLEHDFLRALCMKAVTDTKIGPERFERQFRRLLRAYGADLRETATYGYNQHERNAATSLIIKGARVVATKFRSCCDQTSTVHGKGDEKQRRMEKVLRRVKTFEPPAHRRVDDSDDDFNNRDQWVEREEPIARWDAVKEFLTHGTAFETLCRKLDDFVNSSDLSWSVTLKKFIVSIQSDTETYTGKDVRELKKLVADLRHSDVQSIVVYSHYEQSLLEQAQCRLEGLTSTEWDWWPLRQPNRHIDPELWSVKFPCVSISMQNLNRARVTLDRVVGMFVGNTCPL